ncbi:parallel beta-helix domain-containing protein [Flavobacterium granuli]|uniref:Parallel beta-helix repeat protein n=1 Tax=Flavobacterium granuli TaxID=280093 RepID=A0ABU1S2G6_9FLAO|nr:parallel beta-helix domain-containing protein [Flavobacterium granuli]MDR6845244.1 parallel beta-helix repeat protein [Flavobacterium granuli]
MKKNASIRMITFLSVITVLFSCKSNEDNYKINLSFNPGDESKIIDACLSLKDSTSILLKAGTYKFENLSMALTKHISFKGEGHDKTILDFSSQTQGGEGIRVTNVNDFVFENISIRDSKGDLIKINGSTNVVVRDVHATWKVADSTSGGYAIYPVLCKNVLIENCYASGSSDAGIYVGQSDKVIVRNCKAVKNVAGCEIENTSHADVYDNEFYDNTAGFLIFDLPGLSKRGGFVKAYNNNIHDNNLRNFAKSGSFGTSWGVGNAAPGSGVIILAASNIELYNNKIVNNNTSAITIASGFAVDEKAGEKINDKYFPISQNISIHDNELKMGGAFPKPAYEHHIGKILVAVEQQLNAKDPKRTNKRIPLITYDGISTNILKNENKENPDKICINETEENIFVFADFLNITKPEMWNPSTNVAAYNCK